LIGDQWVALVIAAIMLVGLDSWRRGIRDRAPRWVNILAMLCEVEVVVGVIYGQIGLRRAFHAIESADPSEKTTMLARGISSAMNSNAIAIAGIALAILVLAIGSVLARRRPDADAATARLR
jgi:hypothetical protein